MAQGGKRERSDRVAGGVGLGGTGPPTGSRDEAAFALELEYPVEHEPRNRLLCLTAEPLRRERRQRPRIAQRQHQEGQIRRRQARREVRAGPRLQEPVEVVGIRVAHDYVALVVGEALERNEFVLGVRAQRGAAQRTPQASVRWSRDHGRSGLRREGQPCSFAACATFFSAASTSFSWACSASLSAPRSSTETCVTC